MSNTNYIKDCLCSIRSRMSADVKLLPSKAAATKPYKSQLHASPTLSLVGADPVMVHFKIK